MERILLVTVKLESEKTGWRIEDMALELEELASTCGAAEIVDNITCFREKPTPDFFIGSGKTEEISLLCQQENIDTVIFSHDLSGTQQRNLEGAVGRKTIDRTQLILDIFAQHAKTPEGKTQVELAQLQYLLPRLTGKGIILSRLGGGIGTRGPGEQKLEADRRRIRKKIDKLKDDLKHLALHRTTLRKKRKQESVPVVALVGYTNAGKSTLLNALTGSEQTVADSLFTTLDPLSKKFRLPNGENIVILDTVGFINNLPHHLIEAFKATLEEVVQADLLIHVLDVNSALLLEHKEAVFKVLKELRADDKPMITALNKIDLLEDRMWLNQLKNDFVNPVDISAKLKQNFGVLFEKIQDNFSGRMVDIKITIPHSRMDLVDLLYREGTVKQIDYLQEGIKVKAYLPRVIADKLLHKADKAEEDKNARD